MPNWKKVIVSGSAAEITELKATGLSAIGASERTTLMISTTGVVGTSELGSNAFNSTAFTTNTGTMSSWIIKEGNGTETATVTNGETVTIEDGTGIQSELTSTSSGGTITITNTSPNVVQTTITGNAGTATLAANSTLAGGLAIGTGRNNTANQIVRTNSSGYAEFGWINTTSGNTTGTITDIYVNTNDGYIRKATKSHLLSQLGIASGATNVTNNNQITNGAGYTTNTGTLTPSGTINENEFAAWKTGTSLKAYTAAEMRTALNVPNTTTVITNNNQLTNGAGYITSYTDTNTVRGVRTTNGETATALESSETLNITAGTNVSISESGGVVTISSTDTNTTYSVGAGGLTQQNFTTTLKNKLDGIAASATNVTNNNQITNGAGYTTNVGDITGVTAGGGLSGGGSSGGVTISHSDTSSQSSVNGSGRTYIQDITLDTYGHVTGLATATETVTNTNTVRGVRTTNGETGTSLTDEEILNITAGTNVSISESAGVVTIASTDTNTTTSVKISTDSTYRTGNINFVAGSNISLRENSTGTFQFDADNTTYSADGNYGMTLNGTAFRLENDRRRNSTSTDIYTGNTHDYTFYDASVGIRWYTAGSEDMRLYDNGTLHVDGDVIAYSTTISDERLKDNVTTIENPLDKIKALRGVEYDWNSGSRKGKHDLGLIAQEVEKVIPNIVHEHEMPLMDGAEDGTTYKTVDYEKMVAVLIEGMKEQQSQIDELKLEINKLKGDV